jgi:hypothetical protein
MVARYEPSVVPDQPAVRSLLLAGRRIRPMDHRATLTTRARTTRTTGSKVKPVAGVAPRGLDVTSTICGIVKVDLVKSPTADATKVTKIIEANPHCKASRTLRPAICGFISPLLESTQCHV